MNEVGSGSHSLVQQIFIKPNNISGTVSGAEAIKLNETGSLPSKNSEMSGPEMAIWEAFSWRCQGPLGTAKAARRGVGEERERE